MAFFTFYLEIISDLQESCKSHTKNSLTHIPAVLFTISVSLFHFS